MAGILAGRCFFMPGLQRLQVRCIAHAQCCDAVSAGGRIHTAKRSGGDQNVRSDEVLLLPLALNADTTVYEFVDGQGQEWRLALAYDKILNFESSRCGFFLEFQNVRVLPESTFSEVRINANGIQWNVWLTE